MSLWLSMMFLWRWPKRVTRWFNTGQMLDMTGTVFRTVQEKTVRHIVAWIKQQKDEFKNVSRIEWIPNQQMLADILTKKGVKSDLLLAAVMRGRL